jgi:threonine/homoserine/homoserine lactone efflux protein
MPGTDTLIAFALATAVFAYMPGPAMLYAAAQTLARGRRAGWMAALGIHVGGYVHVLAAAAGLAVLFAAVPTLYLVLKLAGAAYLIWLGAGMILSRAVVQGVSPQIASLGPRRAFAESITVEVLNPKTALFYLAFLPQFTDPAAALPIWVQLVILGTVVNVMFSSADVAVVLLADRLSAGLRASARAARLIRRLGGGILVALGVNLALSRA